MGNLVNRPTRSQLELMERLRRKRTTSYLELFSELDVHHQVNVNVDTIIAAIAREFSDIPSTNQLLGIVAKCYLDDMCDVHLLDRENKIMKHVQKTEQLPSSFDKARGLALHPSYLLIEVYPDCLRAVSLSGEVSVVRE